MTATATQLTHTGHRPPPTPRELGSVERIALFVCAMHRDRSTELLAGFADAPRGVASAFAREALAWDSPTRQARLTREFGVRSDAAERIEQLIVESPPGLRHAIAALLPPELRALFPHLTARPTEPPPALAALARRLVREATRL